MEKYELKPCYHELKRDPFLAWISAPISDFKNGADFFLAVFLGVISGQIFLALISVLSVGYHEQSVNKFKYCQHSFT